MNSLIFLCVSICLQILKLYLWTALLCIIFLIKRLFLVVVFLVLVFGFGFCSVLPIYYPTFSWPTKFLLRNSLLWSCPCMWWVALFLLVSKFCLSKKKKILFVFDFWEFNYNVSQCNTLKVYLMGSFASHEPAYLQVIPHLRKFQLFQSIYLSLLFLWWSWCIYCSFECVSLVHYAVLLYIFFFFLSFLLLWLDNFIWHIL